MLRDSQEGSVSPVFITLFMVTVMLMAAFLDMEWVNYMQRMALQMADFAAEAGGSVHEAWATVLVTRRQYWSDTVNICDEYEPDGITCMLGMSHDEPVLHVRTETIPVGPAKEEDLEDHWTQLAGCRRASPQEMVMAPDWECVAVEISDDLREVRFTADTQPTAEATFERNWHDRGAVRLLGVWVMVNAKDRSVDVQPELQVRSLFGLFPWERTIYVHGKSVTQLDDLVLK